MSGGPVLMSVFAVMASGFGMLFGMFMFAGIVVVRGLKMVVRRGVVMSGGVVMMLGRRMFGSCHRLLPGVRKKWKREKTRTRYGDPTLGRLQSFISTITHERRPRVLGQVCLQCASSVRFFACSRLPISSMVRDLKVLRFNLGSMLEAAMISSYRLLLG